MSLTGVFKTVSDGADGTFCYRVFLSRTERAGWARSPMVEMWVRRTSDDEAKALNSTHLLTAFWRTSLQCVKAEAARERLKWRTWEWRTNLQGTTMQDIKMQDMKLQDMKLQDMTWIDSILFNFSFFLVLWCWRCSNGTVQRANEMNWKKIQW